MTSHSQTVVPDGTVVSMSGKSLVFGDTIEEMTDASSLLGKPDLLRERLAEDGYLLFRAFHERQQIQQSRSEIVDFMSQNGLLMAGTNPNDAIIGRENRATIFRHDVIQTRFGGFRSVVNTSRIHGFFEELLGGETISLDHKWLRAVAHGNHTNAHLDVVYMGRGTKQLFTAWTAFSDISLDMGPLAVCLGSHKLEKLHRTYGTADAHDDLESGWFSDDPEDVADALGIRWASTTYGMGDMVVLGMYFMHGSLDNLSPRYRITSGTRYQLKGEPIDPRHMGDIPDVIPKSENRRSISQARREWGL